MFYSDSGYGQLLKLYNESLQPNPTPQARALGKNCLLYHFNQNEITY